ncbi:self-incompatibility protein 2 [Cucumis melo var. makuwa]|uniref:Self-incompatibility protein 2 n=1 Tax=Cucumis melo var. makuwa TaxID=1194695 RepID=A0A5D3DZ59_CUCMM|nr:self-incompatibility protein 2 [Cucumis melo var. makuwa]TYK28902.1 self-incompatibility protein 2 [Cucumis melo var. makuwa]
MEGELSRRRSSITRVRQSGKVMGIEVRKEVGGCGLSLEREIEKEEGGKKSLVSREREGVQLVISQRGTHWVSRRHVSFWLHEVANEVRRDIG